MTIIHESHASILFAGALHDNTLEVVLGIDPDTKPDPDPEHVAVIAKIVAALSENMQGDQINAWFWQPRASLQGRTPVDVLAGGQWDPEHIDVKRIIEAALSPLCGGSQALHPGRGVPSCPRCG